MSLTPPPHVSPLVVGTIATLLTTGNVLADANADATLPTVRVEASAEASSKETLQATTTRIGKGKQELRDIPQSVTVVTERLIDDRKLDTMKEVLHNTAGVSFLAAEGGEEDIRLRGFSLQASGDIFIDGMRDPAFYERDTFNYDRLEVLRGSASMLFGRGSTGGVVNQVSKEPSLLNRHEITATIGSGRYARLEGDFNLKTGDNAALRMNTMWTGSNTFGHYGAGLDKKGFAGMYRYGIGTSDEFMAGVFHLDNHNGINYGMPWLTPSPGSASRVLVPVDPKNYYGMASDYNAGTASYVTLGHTHRFADEAELSTAFRSGRFKRDQRASTIRFAGAGQQPGGLAVTGESLGEETVLTRGAPNKAMNIDTQTLQSDYSDKFKAFDKQHELLAGIDLGKDKFTGFTPTLPTGVTLPKPPTTIGTPDDGMSVDESLRVKLVNRDFESTSIGAYAQDMVQIAENWKLLGGLRWDSFEGRYRTYSTAPATLGQMTGERSRSDNLWSKRIGVLYQPDFLSSFHFSYGTSFNTSGDAYQYDALGSNTPAEKSRNIELGAKFNSESGDRILRLALFHATKYNERNRDEESVTPTTYLLSGARHAAGLEVDVAGRIGHDWEIYASYAWIPIARIDKGASDGTTLLSGEMVGARPGLTPKHSGTVWATWKASNQWRLGGGLNLRSSMAPQQAASIMAPGYLTVDLMAEYALMRDLDLKLNVTNVTNKLYADFLYRGHYVAGAPRNLQLSATYRF
ncbi:TonB-dependent siderophore receptor [Sterolibacterium denitrificans]|uniref:TonB-dependent siderophore receptor n=1 Tax=Sterolibacterium denitrificans TaxID=157592 RepID=A0A7Z7MUY3_9PROT|nr:TonB-dependent siderophore receptor [Sterolibacterium denitrificans]SMB24829.1 TonB-dependent siderophore receptor [Sterolibacterium denitrificans]